MNKRKRILIKLSALTMIVISIFSSILLITSNVDFTFGAEDAPTMVFSKSKNRFIEGTSGDTQATSGSCDAFTDLGNPIKFEYTNLNKIPKAFSTWQIIQKDGGFMNATKLSGLKSISISTNSSSKSFNIYYSKDMVTDINSEDVTLYSYTGEDKNIIFNFNNDEPNYFKFESLTSNLYINEMVLTYSCRDVYPLLTVKSNNDLMGSVSLSATYKVGSDVNIEAIPNKYCAFNGWYINNELVSDEARYAFVMPSTPLTIIARFYVTDSNTYKLDLSTDNEEHGYVKGSGVYHYLDDVTIEAVSNLGYSFEGWYDISNNKISSDNPYTLSMKNVDIEYIAKFVINSYHLSLNSDDNKGTVLGEGNYEYKTEVSISCAVLKGYSFLGWYDEENNLISKANPYFFSMPYNDICYTAKYEANKYTLSLSMDPDDESKGTVLGSGTYYYQDEVTIIATEKEGYEFIGWYDDNGLVSSSNPYSFPMPFNELNYIGKFVTKYSLTVESMNEKMGTVTGSGSYGFSTEVTIKANPCTGYTFIGWFDDLNNLVSNDINYTFSMLEYDYYLYGQFDYCAVGDLVYLGSYPQTEITDSDLISALNAKAGKLPTATSFGDWNDYEFYINKQKVSYMWYQDVTYNNEKYRGVYFNQYRPSIVSYESSLIYSYQDDNGYYINEIYWFKFEPIEFRILSASDKLLLMSNKVIDSQQFSFYISFDSALKVDYQGNTGTVYPNNYQYSDLRTFLNTSFYNTAFDKETKTKILTTEVDNTDYSYQYIYGEYALCNNTFDKIFALSKSEITNNSYGFNTSWYENDINRQLRPTNYALCLGCNYYSKDSDYSIYWLRTNCGIYVSAVYSSGSISAKYDENFLASWSCIGVVPSLYFQI